MRKTIREWWKQDREGKETRDICKFRQDPIKGSFGLILEGISEFILTRGKETELLYPTPVSQHLRTLR